MTAAAAKSPDKRRDARIALSLGVRLLAGEQELTATLIDFSLTGMAMRCAKRLPLGASVIAYIDKLGRMEGRVARYFPGGFVITYDLTDTKEQRLGAALDRLGADEAVLPDQAPPKADHRKLTTLDGECLDCEIKDASILGVTCESHERPALGTELCFGGAKARVVRYTDTGFTAEFTGYWATVSPWTGRTKR